LHKRRAAKQVLKSNKLAAQKSSKNGSMCCFLNSAVFLSQLGFPRYLFTFLGPYQVAEAMSQALGSKQPMGDIASQKPASQPCISLSLKHEGTY